jgi:D-alanine-D-alanine ligase
MKRVLLITGQGGDAQGWGDLRVTESVRQALSDGGVRVEIAFVATRDDFLRRIERRDFDLAWSALYFISGRADVIGASGAGTLWVADELDARGLPYIGPSSATMKNLIHKADTHRILGRAGVRVPEHHLVAPGALPPEVAFPAFVKPESESRSVGISDRSVVHTRAELEAQVAFVHRTLDQPALVEQYLPGDEYTTLMLGNGRHQEILPGIVRVDPSHYGQYRILRSDLRGVGLTHVSIPESADRAEEARDLVRRATDALECWDHVRVDLRVDAEERLRIIEVNGIPGLKPVKSWSPQIWSLYHPAPGGAPEEYRTMVQLILRSAWERNGLG